MGEGPSLESLRPDDLTVAFQPIFELQEPRVRVQGLEALMRGKSGSGLESAEDLFARARREGVEASVDRTCLRAIFACLGELRPSADVSVNVHASTLGGDPDLPEFLFRLAEAHAVDLARITVEIVEQNRARDDALLRSSLVTLKRAGVSIALDDVGLGYSNYRMMLDCAPDFLKVDRYLVTGCDQDPRRRAILDSVFLLGARLGARVIAEGVESAKELRVLASLGVDLFEGFLLCGPIPAADLRRGVDPVGLLGGLPLVFGARQAQAPAFCL